MTFLPTSTQQDLVERKQRKNAVTAWWSRKGKLEQFQNTKNEESQLTCIPVPISDTFLVVFSAASGRYRSWIGLDRSVFK
jgi:hypothetical protein